MCSQPIVHEAQLSRATPRASASSSEDSRGASANVDAWKLRVGSVAIALNASRFASVPSSRYLAVAGPKERARRSRAAARTAVGSAEPTLVVARTATALSSFDPSTAPSPPRPAWRPSCESVAYLTSRSPAGPIEATRQALPSRLRSRCSASAADRPQRSPAGCSRGPSPSTSSTDGSAQAPRTTIASWPVSLPAMAKWLEASASLSSPVSGDFATTANFALVVSGGPTSGEKKKAWGAPGARGASPGGAGRGQDLGPGGAPAGGAGGRGGGGGSG